jgi:Right handed beta helix region/Carbohydrate binding module (family 6)/Secretion system C-terminal sorting domain/Protein of unknown function (DUF1565)
MKSKITTNTFLCFILFFSFYSNATEIHVAVTGSDTNSGTLASPFKTISKAASVAQPSDVVIIHAGTYREYVDPPTGGTSDADRITFKAAAGDKVFVKGSEVINTWVDNGDNSWKIELPTTYFNGYNPYNLNVDGAFQNYGQWHHRGDVYINNGVLNELQTLEQVKTENYTWYTTTAGNTTTIYANFGTDNPNTQLTEINVREAIFFTSAIDIDYITIDGLRFLHAAPNWQAPNTTTQAGPSFITQIGAVGSKMGKGWIIDNCEVMYSKTAGIMMGESPDDVASLQDITAFGDHSIRNNIITRCGEYGIAGQKGLSRSIINGNRIEQINYRNEFGGFEPAGIKIWNCSDVLIENNLIRGIYANQSNASQSYCIWIDFANQGTRITRNYMEANSMTTTTLFIEANMGPTLIDNNIFVDRPSAPIFVYSAGTIFAHNLFVNSNFDFAIQQFDNGGSGARNVNTLAPHSLTKTNIGTKALINHNKMYNNIFAGGLGPNNFGSNIGTGNVVDRNLYANGTNPSPNHTNTTKSTGTFTHTITDITTGINFNFAIDNAFNGIATSYVNPTLIGTIPLANQSIEDELGNGITVNTDFNSLSRTGTNPKVGPLENIISGSNTISIETAIMATAGADYIPPISIPPGSGVKAPYLGVPIAIPGIIEAENYDFGGQDVSFNDNTTKDGDQTKRVGDNVDIGSGGTGTVVGWIDDGEWLEYTVNIEAGIYTIDLSSASGIANPGELSFTINENPITTIDVTSTSDWNTYTTFTATNFNIPAATNAILRIASSGGFNIDKITFTKTGILGIDDFSIDSINITTNPVQDILSINSKLESIPLLKVFSIDGKLLIEEKTKNLPVSQLPKGVYILRINNKLPIKFIKE